MTEKILVQRDGQIVTVLLNRPERLNALNKSMWQELGEVCKALSGDSTVRCTILRGAKGRAFSAGADVKMFSEERGNPDQVKTYDHTMCQALSAVRAHAHPVVAAIEGVCLGGGVALAAMADLRLCGKSSRFGIPASKLGLPIPLPAIDAVMRLVGHARLLEILLEARIFDAAEAFTMGLIHRVVSDTNVETEALATAHRIASGAPLVHRWHRHCIHHLMDLHSVENSPKCEHDDTVYQFFDTEDYREG